MKKAIIAGAASAVLAAMPVVGVFAADYQSVVDEIQVTVSTTCNMRSSGTVAEPGTTGATLSATVNPGTLIGTGDNATAWTGTPTTLTYNCNDTGGWQITAQGVNSAEASASAQTVLKAAKATSVDIVFRLKPICVYSCVILIIEFFRHND